MATRSVVNIRARWLTVVGAAVLVGGLVPQTARAHFILNNPTSASNQDALGSPQKAYPCGLDAATPGTPTGKVTTYTAGQTINLSITETIYHPGHYRVAIAQNAASLPADPVVTPETSPNNTPCGSVPIATNPTLPILADGILKHTSAFSPTTQTVSVKLPDGFTCNNCTLQVIQWMYNHGLNNPGGCFYHHCATVNIVAGTNSDGGTTPAEDMTTTPSADAATDGGTVPDGCSCELGRGHTRSAGAAGALSILIALGLFRRRVAMRS